MSIVFTLVKQGDEQTITLYPGGGRRPEVADNAHPNFPTILAACLASAQGEDVDSDEVADLFDIAATVERKFQRLGERVSVKGGSILFDGDPVDGALQDQILDFLDQGEDFAPLVVFYEKLATNPLGDVREGLFTWIKGQRTDGNFTITPEGDILGYKAVTTASPEWRTDYGTVFVPSRRGEGVVNGRDVSKDEYIEQVPGDVVEMPRSRVLNAPSRECGDGLHIGTYAYASGFTGDTVMLVKFSPRDIVSLPDSNASWKLRVCRYTVVGPVTEPLTEVVYGKPVQVPEVDPSIMDLSFTDVRTEDSPVGTDAKGTPLYIGDTIEDSVFGTATVGPLSEDGDTVTFLWTGDKGNLGKFDGYLGHYTHNMLKVETEPTPGGAFSVGDHVRDEYGDEGTVTETEDEDGDLLVDFGNDLGSDYSNAATTVNLTRHGKGGRTSAAAKGRGLNPAQDPSTGRFVAGRPGSNRNGTTGRFA